MKAWNMVEFVQNWRKTFSWALVPAMRKSRDKVEEEICSV